jgi:hypothetical protein
MPRLRKMLKIAECMCEVGTSLIAYIMERRRVMKRRRSQLRKRESQEFMTSL